MAIVRIPQFPEAVLKRGPANARADLGVPSSEEVLVITGPLSGQVQSQAVQIENISGMNISQASQISSISGGLSSYATTTYVNSVSGNLATDIANLDISTSQAIYTLQLSSVQVISASPQPATAPMSADRWFTVSISGSNYVLPVYY
jgi:hypothetical protein